MEKKFKKYKDFYTTEVAEFKDMLEAKILYVEGLKGVAAEQYTESFDEALKQVTFLYVYLDVSFYGYFKEVPNEQLVDKPFPGANTVVGDQTKALVNVSSLGNHDEEQVDDSPASS